MRRISRSFLLLLAVGPLSGCQSLLSLIYPQVALMPYEFEEGRRSATVDWEPTPAGAAGTETVGVARLNEAPASTAQSSDPWATR
jgi:hypothetical protein